MTESMVMVVTETTVMQAGALTVAGQWRNFTAFPSILAISVVSFAAQKPGSRDDMEPTSMSSTFIAGKGARSQSGNFVEWRRDFEQMVG